MWPAAVVELHVGAQIDLRLRYRVVSLEIDLLVFDGAPESFHEYIVAPAALAIHADPDAVLLEQGSEFGASELAALVRIEDPRTAIPGKGLVERLDTKPRRERVRQTSGQHPSSLPVDDRTQVRKTLPHRDIRVSRLGEFHPQPLAKPDGSLSTHPAPIIQPMVYIQVPNAQTPGEMRLPVCQVHPWPVFCGEPRTCTFASVSASGKHSRAGSHCRTVELAYPTVQKTGADAFLFIAIVLL